MFMLQDVNVSCPQPFTTMTSPSYCSLWCRSSCPQNNPNALAEAQQELAQTNVLLDAANAALGEATNYTSSLQAPVAAHATYAVPLTLTQGQPLGVLQYLITKIQTTLSVRFAWNVRML